MTIERLAVLAALTLTNAACAKSVPQEVNEMRIDGLSPIISAESGLLGAPIDIAVNTAGAIAVLDYDGQIVMYRDGSAAPVVIGRAGTGPGEFLRPSSFALSNEHLYVADIGNGRLQTLTLDGRLQQSSRLSLTAVMGTVSIDTNGSLLVPTLGLHGTLAERYDVLGRRTGAFGTPLDSVPLLANPRDTKEQLLRGKIPALFRNNVIGVAEPNGNVWLVLNGDGRLERYAPDGTQILHADLDAPELPRVRDEAIQRARASLDDPNGTYPLRYVFDAAFDDGMLWLLLNSTESGPAVLSAVDTTGRTVRRIQFPAIVGARAFAFDKRHDAIYFVIPAAASVVQARMTP